ncbi:MAG: ion transporter [Candidatus Competibacterales bacterium]|nr:ion transporter [Candidatus Competibacterales bacterium]
MPEPHPSLPGGWRTRIGELLARDSRDPWNRRLSLALMVLIGLNVVAVTLESVPALDARFHRQFVIFEVFSIAVFTLEYGLRVWSCIDRSDWHDHHPVRGRIRFMLTPFALIDLIAILPFYLGFVVGHDLRFLRVLRLVRLFKLTRYSIAMQALLEALQDEADSLAAALFLLCVLFVLASGGIYLIEHEVQPQEFGSIPAAMWWAMATLTTVGYGDVVPMTALGKFFGGCITVIGVGMVALPAGIIASGFSEHLRRRRQDSNDILQILLDRDAPLADRRLAARVLGRNLQLSRHSRQRLLRAVLAGERRNEPN